MMEGRLVASLRCRAAIAVAIGLLTTAMAPSFGSAARPGPSTARPPNAHTVPTQASSVSITDVWAGHSGGTRVCDDHSTSFYVDDTVCFGILFHNSAGQAVTIYL